MLVLLATDGSIDARRAARWLREFALPSGTAVSVLTVAILTDPPRDSQSIAELRQKVRLRAGRTADAAARTLRRRWPKIKRIVTEGDPSVEIIRVAEERRVDMIVLGARGLGAVKRFLVGSTSLTVARYAPCPVSIVRGRPKKARRVLVAVDGSEASRAAVRFLSLFELVREARVKLIHVLPKAVVSRRRRSRRSVAAGDRQARLAEATKRLTRAAARLEDAKYPVEAVLAEAREILRVAESRDVDLVVLGARGLGTVGRLLLGSVSETVLHHLGRPMMIVRRR
jgi:nucleotide-binding universal stress UspA family protein